MIDHDKNVGTVLDVLDELGIADDTIVIYSTDNGPHRNCWPDAGTTPFRSEKNTNWEGAYRVPELIRWPGKIKAGSVSNDIIQHHDWLPTLLAAAGDPDVSDKLKKGYQMRRRRRVQGAHRRVQPDAVPDGRGRTQPAARLLLLQRRRRTGRRCASRTGRSSSPSSAARARCGPGPSRSRRCGCPSCSTCAPTRSSTPTSRRTPTTTGSCGATSSSSTRPRWRRSSSTRSRSSRRGTHRPASASTRSSRSSKTSWRRLTSRPPATATTIQERDCACLIQNRTSSSSGVTTSASRT